MKIRIGDQEKTFRKGTSLKVITDTMVKEPKCPVLLARVDGRLRELGKPVESDAEVEPLTVESAEGYETYRRSCVMLFLSALHEICQGKPLNTMFHFSIGTGFYFTVKGDIELTDELLKQIDGKMREMADAAMPFVKYSMNTVDVGKRFSEKGRPAKEKLFRTRIVSRVNMYSLGNYEDYYYGFMVYDTSVLKSFELLYYRDGIILNLPSRSKPLELSPFVPSDKLMDAQLEGEAWATKQGIPTIGDLNDKLIYGDASQMILVAEAMQEGRIAELAAEITSRPDVKFVMIAGPSSSGKTTFSKRLSTQILARGMVPHCIGVDNYFHNRADMKPGPDGTLDFESLSAVDVEGFNRDMKALLNGERVEMPIFDFIEGKRVMSGEYITLGEGELLVIEGIHCLNDALSYALPPESKYKISVSALTQLNVDETNRIPTADGRLLRRIIRDNRTRGYTAAMTISRWKSVRDGEEKNIFPYQESADAFFNSALPYEIAALKIYAQPLLFQIPLGDPAYQEAKRLLKFLDYFIAIPADQVPANSILREFIGGGCFRL